MTHVESSPNILKKTFFGCNVMYSYNKDFLCSETNYKKSNKEIKIDSIHGTFHVFYDTPHATSPFILSVDNSGFWACLYASQLFHQVHVTFHKNKYQISSHECLDRWNKITYYSSCLCWDLNFESCFSSILLTTRSNPWLQLNVRSLLLDCPPLFLNPYNN